MEDAFRDSYLGGPLPQEEGDGWAVVTGMVSRRAARRRALGYAAVLVPLLMICGGGALFVLEYGKHPEKQEIIAGIAGGAGTDSEQNGGSGDKYDIGVDGPGDADKILYSNSNDGIYIIGVDGKDSVGNNTLNDDILYSDSKGSREDVVKGNIIDTDGNDAQSPLEDGLPSQARTESLNGDSEQNGADGEQDNVGVKAQDGEMVGEPERRKAEGRRKRERNKRPVEIDRGGGPLIAANISLNGSPATNGKFSSTGGQPSYMPTAAPFSPDVKLAQTSAEDAYSEAQFRHHTPIGAGVGVNFMLGHGLAVETGVSYTMYWSEFEYKGDRGRQNQYIHYVGVPLQLDWYFLRRPKFSIYSGLGARMDICAGAKVAGEKADEKALQWTGVATVGAAYNFNDHISLYLRPELDWYITRTSLNSIRNAGPVNVTLRAGFTFSF